ncbi:MAG: EVE domain-containing protein [Candidatus Hodarchaeota archaeon]
MNYWLCVTNDDNWEVIRKKRVWGVPERRRNLIKTVAPGDQLVIYVAPKRIGGIFEVVSRFYERRDKIFKEVKGEIFPYRVDLSPIMALSEPKGFMEIREKLSFIPDTRYWSAPLRRGMVKITEEDFQIIEKYLEA